MSRPENLLRSLGERLADLQKQVEALSAEKERLKNEQVIARSEEKKTGGAKDEKTIAGEKPQAVLVSGGQKAEDSKQDQQLREEREPRALSRGAGKSFQTNLESIVVPPSKSYGSSTVTLFCCTSA